MLRDSDRDGVAESLDLFLTMGVAGAENTGMIWDPNNPHEFLIAIQHHASMSVAGGMGDALWKVTVPEPAGLAVIAAAALAALARRRP